MTREDVRVAVPEDCEPHKREGHEHRDECDAQTQRQRQRAHKHRRAEQQLSRKRFHHFTHIQHKICCLCQRCLFFYKKCEFMNCVLETSGKKGGDANHLQHAGKKRSFRQGNEIKKTKQKDKKKHIVSLDGKKNIASFSYM